MSPVKTNLAVFLSGGGTGLQSIIDASLRGDLSARVAWVVSSSSKAYGLQRAAKAGIETFVFKPKKYASVEEAGTDLLGKLRERKIEYIALAGYLKLLPANVVAAFPKRILNIHPGLLPKYGGKGMYGSRVHRAVLDYGAKISGITVHFVDEEYDGKL